jgi:hypothetical protein
MAAQGAAMPRSTCSPKAAKGMVVSAATALKILAGIRPAPRQPARSAARRR